MPRLNPKRVYESNKYAAGNTVYPGGSPNKGSKLDPLGYRERDAAAKMRMNAILRRIKAKRTGNYMSSDYLKSPGPLS